MLLFTQIWNSLLYLIHRSKYLILLWNTFILFITCIHHILRASHRDKISLFVCAAKLKNTTEMDLLYNITFHIFHSANNLDKLYLGNIFLTYFSRRGIINTKTLLWWFIFCRHLLGKAHLIKILPCANSPLNMPYIKFKTDLAFGFLVSILYQFSQVPAT